MLGEGLSALKEGLSRENLEAAASKAKEFAGKEVDRLMPYAKALQAAEAAKGAVEQWAERSSKANQKHVYNIMGNRYEFDHELSVFERLELVVMDDFKRRWGFTKAAAHGVVSGAQEVINTLYDVENALSEYLPDWMRYGLIWETVDGEVRFSFGKAEGQLTAPQLPNVAAPETAEDKLISDISRIMFGLLSAGKILKGMKIAESLGTGFKAMLQGGIVDFAFTPSNSSFFASPDDTPMEGRLKNLGEGIVLGKMVDELMRNLSKSLDDFLKAVGNDKKAVEILDEAVKARNTVTSPHIQGAQELEVPKTGSGTSARVENSLSRQEAMHKAAEMPQVNEVEKQACLDYTDKPTAKALDNGLRFGNLDTNLYAMRDSLDATLSRASTTEDMVLYRGAPSSVGEGLEVGSPYSDKGFLSASSSFETASQYSCGCIFEVKLPKGSHAMSMNSDTYNIYDNEILLKRDFKFKVSNIEYDKICRKIITLEVDDVY